MKCQSECDTDGDGMMRNALVIGLMGLGILSGCVSYEDVLVDGKYDVRVITNQAPTSYAVAHTRYDTMVRPSENKAAAVYMKAIEQVSGCTVSNQNIMWVGNPVQPRAGFRAYPDC